MAAGDSLAMSEVTRILSAIEQGDPRAAGKLLPLVYDELRGWPARGLLARSRGRASSLPTWCTRPISGSSAKVTRSSGTADVTSSPRPRRRCAGSWSRMARRKNRLKHGGGRLRVELEAVHFLEKEPSEDLEAIDEALDQAGRGRPGEGRAGQAPLLRRLDHARDRAGVEDLAGNRRASLDLRPHLALCRAQRPERFREYLKGDGSV